MVAMTTPADRHAATIACASPRLVASGLSAKDMKAGLGGGNCLRVMPLVGQRDVDRVDAGSKNRLWRLVTASGMPNVQHARQQRVGVFGLLRQRGSRACPRRPLRRPRRAALRLHHRAVRKPRQRGAARRLRDRLAELRHRRPSYRVGRLPLRRRPRRRARPVRDGKTRPDAIFCANDLLAMGAMDAIRTDRRPSRPRT